MKFLLLPYRDMIYLQFYRKCTDCWFAITHLVYECDKWYTSFFIFKLFGDIPSLTFNNFV